MANIRRIFLAGSLLVVSAGLHAQAASFDCGKAATPTERAICASPQLGRKDVIAATYFQLLLRLKPAVAGMAYREFYDNLRSQQAEWLRHDRDACGADAACLGRSYDLRIAALLKTFDDNAGLTFGQKSMD